MISETRDVVLTKSHAACLVALRAGKSSSTQIAVTAGLSINTASLALGDLEVLGLAEQSPEAVWRATSRGQTCLVVPSAGGSHEVSRELSPNGRRLLELLERPTQGRSIAKKLGVSRQGALHIMRRLCAQGHVKFGDPEDPSWWVMRAEDETPLLTREEEERVLSAIPGAYSTNALQIRASHADRRGSDRNHLGTPRGLRLRRGRRRIQRRRAFPGYRRRSQASATPYGHPLGGSLYPSRVRGWSDW